MKPSPTPRRDDQRRARALRILDDQAAHGLELAALKAADIRKRIARSEAAREAYRARLGR